VSAIRRAVVVLTALGMLLPSAVTTLHTPSPAARPQSGPGRPAPGWFQVVGRSALLARGMNAALAIAGHYAYIGSRTDGSHAHAGVLVVDIAQPARPRIVGQIAPPDEGNPGETSRELRVWPRQHLLLVLNFACSPAFQACAEGATVTSTVRVYDIAGRHAAAPRCVATYTPSRQPHEFFLWVDPHRPDRALLYLSTPSLAGDNLLVTDISQARAGRFREIATWTAHIRDPTADTRLHSLSVSPDGRRAYLAYLGAGVLIADTSDLAAAAPHPRIRLLTPVANRAHWGNPGAHSAVALFGRPYLFVTDEVYGTFAGLPVGRGCPWGWTRLLDIHDPTRPRLAGQYKIYPYNDPASCRSVPPDREMAASFSPHNPTLTPHLAFVTWHSGGLQAVTIADPAHPRQAAAFLPAPLATVQTEDPILSSGRDKVVLWSYPIITHGLIYVVDLRNGLYILRYHGPFAAEVACIHFLEGNSNLGDTLQLARPRVHAAPCRFPPPARPVPACSGGRENDSAAGRCPSGRAAL
jgi:hypothetical protein